MMWAKMNRIPVLTLPPKRIQCVKDVAELFNVRVENWGDPFVELLSDAILESMEEGQRGSSNFCMGFCKNLVSRKRR